MTEIKCKVCGSLLSTLSAYEYYECDDHYIMSLDRSNQIFMENINIGRFRFAKSHFREAYYLFDLYEKNKSHVIALIPLDFNFLGMTEERFEKLMSLL